MWIPLSRVPTQGMETRGNGQVATRGELSDRDPTVMPGSVPFLLLEFVEIGLYFLRFETFQPIFQIKVFDMGLDIVHPDWIVPTLERGNDQKSHRNLKTGFFSKRRDRGVGGKLCISLKLKGER